MYYYQLKYHQKTSPSSRSKQAFFVSNNFVWGDAWSAAAAAAAARAAKKAN